MPTKKKAPASGNAAEKVQLDRRGVPAVDPSRTTQPARKKRVLGTLRGKIRIIDPDWWKPQSDD